jgi:mannose-6-phosphate isomerase-like protein (cupin superfamily)
MGERILMAALAAAPGERAGQDLERKDGEMLGWVGDIEKVTKGNDNFRTVVFTGGHVQLTVMRLGPGEDIGAEAHPHLDQFLRIEQGRGRVEFGETRETMTESHALEEDWAIIVPAGVWHNVINTGGDDLKLYSLYSPPEHAAGTVHVTKADAEAAEADHHG